VSKDRDLGYLVPVDLLNRFNALQVGGIMSAGARAAKSAIADFTWVHSAYWIDTLTPPLLDDRQHQFPLRLFSST